jgi:hypothetical protein
VPSYLEHLLQVRSSEGASRFDSLLLPSSASASNPEGDNDDTMATAQILEAACQIAQEVDEILSQADSQRQCRGERSTPSPSWYGGQ